MVLAIAAVRMKVCSLHWIAWVFDHSLCHLSCVVRPCKGPAGDGALSVIQHHSPWWGSLCLFSYKRGTKN